MTREDVVGWLESMQEDEHNKADSIVPCTTEIALGIAIEALKQPQIVRCKECKYYGEIMGSCAKLDGYDYMPDFYCACGERKDN